MRYNYPSVPYQGQQIKVMTKAYQAAGAKLAPSLLLHSNGKGQELIQSVGRLAATDKAKHKGLPAHLIPLGLHPAHQLAWTCGWVAWPMVLRKSQFC
jgi:hypothetical protein